MISYRIAIADAHAHLLRITLTVPQPATRQRLSLPVWIPGSYLVREFGRHVSCLEARQGARALPLEQLDKTTWQATCEGRAALEVNYLVYAFDPSVRTAYLDTRRAFLNGTSVCLRVEGRENEAHRLEVRSLPRDWEVATGMTPVQTDAAGRGTYEAADYDELVDHPVELGAFWRGHFMAHGVPHEFVVAGALPDFDAQRLLADVQRICETAITFWHTGGKPPFARYVFMLNHGRRLRRPGAPCEHSPHRCSARPAPAGQERADRRLRHAARAHLPRVLPHLERQAPETARVRVL
jgi:predicted metalloprotease with PDZ domain